MKKAILAILVLLVFSAVSLSANAGHLCHEVQPKKCADGSEGKVYVLLLTGYDRFSSTVFRTHLQDVEIELEYMSIRNLEITSFGPNDDPRLVSEYLSELSIRMRPCDTFIFVYNGHGNEDGLMFHSSDQYIHYNDLAVTLYTMNGYKIVFTQSCQSGRFIENVMRINPPNTIAIGGSTGCENDWVFNPFTPIYFTFLRQTCDFTSAYIRTRHELSLVGGRFISTMKPDEGKLSCDCNKCKEIPHIIIH